ncbi:mechanosensitive ion channel family protein [Fulvivirgaceae bacterium BMA12]|uniref:Mechanosensitive ion channel family protein n=1 Tax=Agaribacillus aureus TaxID=3051825 RepID=A0ABT8LCA7_9BACT|nr:mechanosensitive ion channel family protein [Fulvivirgaceae bacterium BMA12]
MKFKTFFSLLAILYSLPIMGLELQNQESDSAGLYDLSSPFGAIYTHFENLQEYNYHPEIAARPFLRNGVSLEEAEKLAIKLKHIFDGKIIYLDQHDFPTNPNYVDSLTRRQKYVLASQVPEVYVVKEGNKWMYSQTTIESIDRIYKKTYPFGTDKLLTWLPKIGNDRYFGLYIWQLIGLLIIITACFIIHKILTFLIGRILTKVLVKIGKKDIAKKVIHPVAKPISLFLVFWLASLSVPALQLPINTYYKYILMALRASLPVFATMVFYHLVDLLSEYFKRLAEKTETTLDDQLVPLVRKALKTFVVVIGVFYTLYNLNVDIIPLLTGLSIGGLAFALAAQDTIKNFFGSFMIFVDKPFQIGDWITTGEIDGSVEEVGFRSTRVRTFRNSVVYVPNGKLADSTIDNHGLRVYRRFYTKIALTYDTPPALIQIFVDGLEKIVKEHPHTRKDYYNVFLNDMAAHSLDVMFYIFFEVPTWPDELKARQEVIMSIISLADRLGVRFAFPTQTLHLETLPGQDALTPAYVESEEVMRKKMEEFFARDQGNKA